MPGTRGYLWWWSPEFSLLVLGSTVPAVVCVDNPGYMTRPFESVNLEG
jgi:hypothetical protein